MRVVPLDAAFLLNPKPAVRLIKMDVQGFEVRLLRGAHYLLSDHHVTCIIFEVAVDWLRAQGTSTSELWQLFAHYGYDVLDLTYSAVPLGAFAKLGDWSSDYIACVREAVADIQRGRP